MVCRSGLSLPIEFEREGLLTHPSFQHLKAPDLEKMGLQLIRIEWQGGVTVDADSLMRGPLKHGGSNKVKLCEEWLTKFLAEFAFPSKEIEAAANKEGFTQDNVFRAKANLKAKGLKNTNRVEAGGWWSGFGPVKDWKDRPESGATLDS